MNRAELQKMNGGENLIKFLPTEIKTASSKTGIGIIDWKTKTEYGVSFTKEIIATPPIFLPNLQQMPLPTLSSQHFSDVYFVARCGRDAASPSLHAVSISCGPAAA